MINSFKTLDVEMMNKTIKYYKEDCFLGYNSIVYLDNYNNIIHDELINKELIRCYSNIINNGLDNTVYHTKM